MKLKDFIFALEKQKGKIFKHSDGSIWKVNAIDYREGILVLSELTDTPFEPCIINLNVFKKRVEEFTELIPDKEEEINE